MPGPEAQRPKPSEGSDPNALTGGAAIREFLGYQILDRVATDADAGTVTYRARQKSLGRLVRITILPRASALKPGFLTRFQRQCAVASRLQHDNILSAFDTGTQAGILYVVFEELDGVTLADELESKGALPVPRLIDIAMDVTRALDHVNTQGLVHRNVVPRTIHLPEHAPAKLTGLSVAKVRQASGAETWIEHDGQGARCVAPEIVRDSRGIDIRADIYSLGCVVYNMATGGPVFVGGTPASILARHVTEKPHDPRTLRDGLPDALVRVLDRCLRKVPAERYPTPIILLRDLERVKAGKPVERGPGAPLWPERVAAAKPTKKAPGKR